MLEIGNPADEWQVDVIDRLVADWDDDVKACILDAFCPLGWIGMLTNEDRFERVGRWILFRAREKNHFRIAIVPRQFEAPEHHPGETRPCGPAFCGLIEKSDAHKIFRRRQLSMRRDTRQAPARWAVDARSEALPAIGGYLLASATDRHASRSVPARPACARAPIVAGLRSGQHRAATCRIEK